MTTARNSRILRTIPLLVTICLFCLTAQAQYGGGTGEPNDPYQIATAEDLAAIGSDPNLLAKHFVLVNDIDLDPNLPDGHVFNQAVIAPDPDQGTSFAGSFDGNGHAIANLTIDAGTAGFLGLFGKIGAGGSVHNLRIQDALIAGADGCRYLGALAGYIDEDCTITNCSATGRVTAGANAGAIGGLAGFVWFGGRVTQCFASCDVYGGDKSEDLGGMVGANGGDITNCYSSGSVSGGNGCNRLGGLVGVNKATISQWGGSMSSRGHIIHCYATSTVSGGNEGNNLGGLVGERGESHISTSFWDIGTSGMLESDGGTGVSTAEMQDANTFIAARWDLVGERINGTADLWLIPQGGGYPMLAFFSDSYHRRSLDGTGSLDDPYRIATAEDLGAICHYDRSACYKLVADIDLSGITWATAPFANFNGTLDGAGFVLSNLTAQGEGDLGLFCVLDTCAHVRNLGVEDANIPGGGCVGALAGLNYGHITDCFVGGNVSGDDCVGLLVGYNKECGGINNSHATGAVSARDARYYVGGGLVGYNIGMITNSHACVEVTAQDDLGGFVGSNRGDICGCYASGRLTGEGQLGGLVSSNSGRIVNCYATVDVYSRKFSLDVGGLVGYNSGTVVNCYAAGSILNELVEDSFQGGLIGRSQWPSVPAAVVNCFWNTQTSGIDCSDGGIGLTTAQMMDPVVYSLNGWAGDPNWVLDPGNDYPRLAWEGKAGRTIPEPVIDWLDGSGTQEDPFIIATAEQLARIGTASILWDKVFVLASDLDLTGIDLPRIGVCPGTDFTGTFDGNGHTISNFTYTSIATDHTGLFGYVSQGHIKELGLIDPHVDAGIGDYVGSLVGFLNNGTITNCYVEGGSVAGNEVVGGLVGANSGTITYSYSAVSVSGDKGVCGLVGGGYKWRVTASFWDIEISGQTTSAGGMGKTTAEMQTASTFLDAGWDFVGETANGTEDIWWITEGQDYPRLTWQLIEGR